MKHLYLTILVFSINYCLNAQNIENPVFRSDSISVTFTDNVAISFDDYFEDQRLIDSYSKIYDNWHERALAIEKHQLEKYKPLIVIDGTNRIVTLKNGKKIVLSPDNRKEEAEYTYEKSLLNGSFYLFRVQWFEGNDYLLLNTLNGEKTYTFGKIYVSPKNNFLVSINLDITAGYSSNGFQIFRIEKDNKLKKLWEYESNMWGPKNIKWISDKSLIVLGNIYDKNDNSKLIEFYKKIEINVP